jgi:ATP-binding cassette subfamily C (CFTR/MRP) protein 1
MALVGGSSTLLTNRAFTSLAVIALLGAPLASLIQAIPGLVAAVACFRRIQAFLKLPEHMDHRQIREPHDAPSVNSSLVVSQDSTELRTSANPQAPPSKISVQLSAATISITDECLPVLSNVSFSAEESHLVAVTGPVGSGKTTLVQALLSEVPVTTGSVATTTRSIPFCAQTTWLHGGSLREQILFGKAYDADWYAEVIRSCALVYDLASFPLGDATQVGKNGDKLSGGQKQRIVSDRMRTLPSDLTRTSGHCASCLL